LVEALKVAREYFGPEAEHWLDDEVVHRLMIRALDLGRRLDELRPKASARGVHQTRGDESGGLLLMVQPSPYTDEYDDALA